MAILGVGELGGSFSTTRRMGDCSVCAGEGRAANQNDQAEPSQTQPGQEIKNEPAIRLELAMVDIDFPSTHPISWKLGWWMVG